jgi:pimeloyl-ACP methyl ester carboxylesterase
MKTWLPAVALFAACAAPALAAPAPAPTAASPAGQTQLLAVSGGSIAYDDTGGPGPLVVAIPGMGDLRSEYRFVLPALQAAGYRVVTMDVRGCGESSAQWSDYSAHAVGGDALALIGVLGAGPAVILGDSFAAGAALWAAHDAPQRVRGVVLLGPVVRDQPVSWTSRLMLDIGFAGPWRERLWLSYRDSLFPAAKPADHAAVRAALAQNLAEPGRMAALRTMILQPKADTAAILSQSRVPALIVMGTRDPDFADPAAEAKWLGEQLHAATVLIDGAGHYPHAEMPARVIPALWEFLAAH